MIETQPSLPAGRRTALIALLLTVPVPSIGTYLAMVAFPDSTIAKVGFGIAKVLILLAPLIWLIKVEGVRPKLPRPNRQGMLAAVITGSLIVACIYAAYWAIGERWVDLDALRAKMAEMKLDHPAIYLLGALYWCTVNSILEEYFWRWFVFLRLRELVPSLPRAPGAAVFGSALLFTAHHVIALKANFPWNVTLLASLGVFIGGVTWSWLYMRYRNIYAAYVSHVFADIVIFYIGYRLIFG